MGSTVIYTCVRGTNADLLARVLALYVPGGALIADVTCGLGAFWRAVPPGRYRLIGSDLGRLDPRTGCRQPPAAAVRAGGRGPAAGCGLALLADCRRLPYRDASVDCWVFDPPYAHNSTASISTHLERQYHLNSVCGRAQVLALYRDGLAEGWRVLRPGGLALVKCQDEIMSNKQQRTTIEVWQMALALGFRDEDQFVLHAAARPRMRHPYQKHARKNHSVLWVFRKPGRAAP